MIALPSASKVVTIHCGQDAAYAQTLLGRLLSRGIFVRNPMSKHIDYCIRVSVRQDNETEAFEHAFKEANFERDKK
ncbi:hypothetical protein [Bartonella tamiae]|uniref:Aminotransferase class I/classII domain-containing protein n=1 Tax=Bartonella tamiae Th239 TaxID=1094558 RepID=J1K0N8_9HYPH|nr:hypothetical protein [Bartonella tamiae]EJF90600.1 hypothetical protein ME5_01001 [Bartonella tamiae Th239]EJF94022.1 hypothetical protein MEG_00880 [Bartonella tamiae Th307]